VQQGRLPTTSVDTKAIHSLLAAVGPGPIPVLVVSVAAVSVLRALVASLPVAPRVVAATLIPAPLVDGCRVWVVETFRADLQLRAGCSSITRQGNQFRTVTRDLKRVLLGDDNDGQDHEEPGPVASSTSDATSGTRAKLLAFHSVVSVLVSFA
jgi:hypothetical protein